MRRLPLRLFTRPGCHLCEQAQAQLGRLHRRYPHDLTVVDISQDQDLVAQYGERIPVLVIGEREYGAPLGPAILERALREAQPR